MTSPHNAVSREKLNAVRADAQKGNGGLDAALRAAVFEYASARALQKSADAQAQLTPSVKAFVDAVLTRAIDADVDALKREGRSEDFIYELAIVASVAAGSARGLAAFSLLKASAA